MALSIKCPHCGRVLKAGEEAAGKRVHCPACKKPFLAPKAPSQAASPATPKVPPPPAGAPRAWHLHVDGRNLGPYTVGNIVDQVQTGKVDAETLAWREGMDDWRALGKIKEFRGALSAPPPVRKKSHREKDQERHQRYVPGKGKRDLVLGTWVAIGLAVVLLVAILIIVNRPKPTGGAAPAPEVVRRYEQPSQRPGTITPSGEIIIRGPRPDHVPRKTVVRQLPNEKVLGKLVADLDQGFKAAIAAHRKADRKPIYNLALKLKSHADQIASRKWGAYQTRIDTLVQRLNAASEGMKSELKERTEAWDMGDGLTPEKKAELLELNKVDWLENWKRNLNEDIEQLRKKGLNF